MGPVSTGSSSLAYELIVNCLFVYRINNIVKDYIVILQKTDEILFAFFNLSLIYILLICKFLLTSSL